MTTYGYGENKGKREVYTKEETDTRYVLKDNFAVVTLTHLFNGQFVDEEGTTTASLDINYPEGFNKENSYVVSSKLGDTNGSSYSVIIEQNLADNKYCVFALALGDEGINVCYYNSNEFENAITIVIEIVLMKI